MGTWQDQSLFAKPTAASIHVPPNHELVRLTALIRWRDLINIAVKAREQSRKRLSGSEPRYRQLLGAVVLMAVRGCNYRDAEDLISYYAPARHLCDLMGSNIRLDHVTIFEFTQMLGEGGMESINKVILQHAVVNGLCDPTHLMSDTTAQEARIPYPTEAGLMNRFMSVVGRTVGRLRGKFDGLKKAVSNASSKVKGLLRNAHLFAKGREQKQKIERKMYHTVKEIQKKMAAAIASGASVKGRAGEELQRVNQVMGRLLPQIKHFFDTGFVAAKKIIHLKMPEVYSIVRGKAGKTVEFGLKWGISRVGGGFVQGFLLAGRRHGADTAFCKQSIRLHQATFGSAPEVFGYDRGGDSDANIRFAKKQKVKHIGIAPRGKRAWPVSKKMAERIRCERAQVEGSIGTIKCSRYGFTKPRAFSVAAMERCGHRSILGFNMRKMVILSAEAAT